MQMKLGEYIRKAAKALAEQIAGEDKRNAAQRLLASWLPPAKRKPYQPKRPHLIWPMYQTDAQHTTREGVKVERWAKVKDSTRVVRVPVMLKQALPINQSKQYPYAGFKRNGGVLNLAA